MFWTSWRFFAIGATIVLGACSEPATTPAGGGLPDAAAGPDTSTSGQDVAADAASQDASGQDTSSGGDIQAVVCKALGQGECDTAAECGSGKYCDPCTRECKEERKVCDPCTADVQCKDALVGGEPGSVCLPYQTGGSFCGQVCLSTAGCGPGYTCEQVPGVAAKQCVPKTKSCAPGSGQCKLDADCPYQSVCSTEWGVCVKGCTTDQACVAGTVCSLGHCVEPCAGDADCAGLSAEAKCVDKHCKIPGGCLGSDECVQKETHCDLKTHKCVPGCEVDSDCKDFALKCEAAKCVQKGCKANWECAFGMVCDVATAQCKKAEGPYCAPCDPNDEEAKACGGKPNRCFSFKDAKDQDKGSFCGVVCGSDPGGPCPQGWQCQELKDDKGQSQGKYCLRPCYTQPVGGGTNP